MKINSLTRGIYKLKFKVKKHSPEILVAAGIVGAITSTVMACRATTKLGDILDESKEEIADIKYYGEHPEELENVEYTTEDVKKDVRIVYAHMVLDIAKIYAPSVILGTMSLTSIVSSNNILRKRNVAISAAYTALNTQFKEYRDRVIDRFGKEVDRELKYNIKSEKFEEKVIDEKTGKEKTVKKEVDVLDPNSISEFAKFFDDGCTGWEKDPELNLIFLRNQQNWANNVLQTRGYLFLNEVYDMLGIPKTKIGQVCGWIYDEKNPIGDNFVDFGIFDGNKPKNRDFVNGYERTILLDFNCDGNILDLM